MAYAVRNVAYAGRDALVVWVNGMMLYDCEIEYFGGPKDGRIEVVQLEGVEGNVHSIAPPATQKPCYILCGCFVPYGRPRFRYRMIGVKFDHEGFGDTPQKAPDMI